MSRFAGDESDSWEDDPTQYLWESWKRRAMFSKAAIKRWAMIAAALLALPEPRLCEDALLDIDYPDGEHGHAEVCAVGAVVLYQEARQARSTVPELLAVYAEEGCRRRVDSDIWETVDQGVAAGLPRTLAWWLAELNDETLAGRTPEDRYRLVLDAVRERKRAAEALHAQAP
jgi:hypothetical protein